VLYRLVLIATIVGVVLGLMSLRAWACSCAGTTKTGYAEAAAVVFTGTVTSVDRPLLLVRTSSVDPIQVEFRVDAVYKGEATRTTWVTTTSGAGCGSTYAIGRFYTVFPRRVGDRLDADVCWGDVEGAIDPQSYSLGAGYPPASDPPQTLRMLIVAGTILATFAFIALERLRKPPVTGR